MKEKNRRKGILTLLYRGSAPPPAPEQVIETLPKRGLTEKEKSNENVM